MLHPTVVVLNHVYEEKIPHTHATMLVVSAYFAFTYDVIFSTTRNSTTTKFFLNDFARIS